MNLTGCWLALGTVLVCFQSCPAAAQWTAPARNVVCAVYEDGQVGEPAAILRVQRIYRGCQRKAFFRIGALPIAVLDGVVIELRRPEAITHALADCRDTFGKQTAGRLELRNVEVVTFGAFTNRLWCGRAQPLSDGRWELLQGVRFETTEHTVQAPSGVLVVDGEQPGQLILPKAPASTHNLCAPPSGRERKNL